MNHLRIPRNDRADIRDQVARNVATIDLFYNGDGTWAAQVGSVFIEEPSAPDVLRTLIAILEES